MTLHGLIRRISDILTPGTHSFYDYVLQTSDDDGGFLRTCFCFKHHALPDREIEDRTKAVVCFMEPFTESYTDNGRDTCVKLQLSYGGCRGKNIPAFIRWSWGVGFRVAYVFDLEAGTYEVTDRREATYEDL
ncbi:MAG: hypothetical protein J6C43_02685 [Oscillospiraceae bacterium]|nr:hypothetical protein [Oscillospiraceae bacterium]MBP3521328.1 hypothetical protein [Oscillospiraceae bacterium]